MRKCAATGHDPNLAMSIYRDTPLTTKVHLQSNQWTPATVTKTPVASQPRSYSVETANGAQLVRNRRFIHPPQETDPIPAKSVKRDDSSSNERPRRVIARPKRLLQTI